MKAHVWIVILGIYMLAMGITGYVRTGSPTALYINGGIAVATIIIGFLVSKGIGAMRVVSIAWVGINTFMLSFMTYKRLTNPDAREGSELIFGSMALLALIVLIVLLTGKKESSAEQG